MKRFLLLCVLSICPLGCHHYLPHPGAANTADSAAYDALLDAQTTIDTARPQFASGDLPANLKPSFNDLVKAYDRAMPAWKAYHAEAVKNPSADQTAMKTALNELAAVLATFRKGLN